MREIEYVWFLRCASRRIILNSMHGTGDCFQFTFYCFKPFFSSLIIQVTGNDYQNHITTQYVFNAFFLYPMDI